MFFFERKRMEWRFINLLIMHINTTEYKNMSGVNVRPIKHH